MESRFNTGAGMNDLFMSLAKWPATYEELVVYRKTIVDVLSMVDKMIPGSGNVTIEERLIPGAQGAPDVPVLIYSPSQKTRNAPGLLYFHGGGFIMCNAKMMTSDCVRMVEKTGCIIVSIDYRLAPEHPFPAAFDDCYSALRWMFNSASELGLDTTRIAVGGGSAGACLAAAVALKARDSREHKLIFQLLLSGCFNDHDITRSRDDFTKNMTPDQLGIPLIWESYLGKGGGEISPYAAPARAKDLSGLPPAYILTGELDPLRDENIEYAVRLLQAGVSTELHVFPQQTHGFEMFPFSTISLHAIEDYTSALDRAFNP